MPSTLLALPLGQHAVGCSVPCVLQGTLFARRKAAAVVRGDAVLHKLFTEIAERYAEREGGYTRVLRSRRRNNDAAQMAFIECAFQSTGPLQFVRTTRCLQLCTCLPFFASDPVRRAQR